MALGGGVHDLQESLGPGDAVHVPARADRDVPPGHGSHAVVAPRAAASSDSVSASSGADSDDDDDDDDDEFVDSWGDRRPYWLPCLAPRWAGALIQRSARQAEPGGDASIYIRTLPGADVLAVIAQCAWAHARAGRDSWPRLTFTSDGLAAAARRAICSFGRTTGPRIGGVELGTQCTVSKGSLHASTGER